MIGNQVVNIYPGQMVTSRRKIEESTKLNRSKIERFLKVLEIEQQIEQQTFTKYRIISITNWNKYQQIEQQSEQQVSNKRATSEHKQECKEGKEGKEKTFIAIPQFAILKALNEATGSRFKATAKFRSLVQARWNEGFRLEDFEHVFKVKADEWGNDPKMCKYLRPDTLLGTKFNSYRQQKKRMDTSEFLRSLENDE